MQPLRAIVFTDNVNEIYLPSLTNHEWLFKKKNPKFNPNLKNNNLSYVFLCFRCFSKVWSTIATVSSVDLQTGTGQVWLVWHLTCFIICLSEHLAGMRAALGAALSGSSGVLQMCFNWPKVYTFHNCGGIFVQSHSRIYLHSLTCNDSTMLCPA